MNLLRGTHRVWQFSWPLLGLSLYSYRVRELLVCWLFFGGMFAALGSVVAGGMIAWYGGKCAIHWANAFVRITPAVLSDPVELRLKANLGPQKVEMTRILRIVHAPKSSAQNRIKEDSAESR